MVGIIQSKIILQQFPAFKKNWTLSKKVFEKAAATAGHDQEAAPTPDGKTFQPRAASVWATIGPGPNMAKD